MTADIVDLLHRRLYGIGQAAELLGVTGSRLRRWLDGEPGRMEPVIRAEPTGDDVLTWGEFVEARYLAGYRRAQVSLQKLRPIILAARHQLATPYPLAREDFWVSAGELFKAQEEADLPDQLVIWRLEDNQLLLTPLAERFFERVEWVDRWAARLRPLGKASPVVIDPAKRFGEPSIRGVRTAVIAELFDAGETIHGIAIGYNLEVPEVEEALRYQRRYRPAA